MFQKGYKSICNFAYGTKIIIDMSLAKENVNQYEFYYQNW